MLHEAATPWFCRPATLQPPGISPCLVLAHRAAEVPLSLPVPLTSALCPLCRSASISPWLSSRRAAAAWWRLMPSTRSPCSSTAPWLAGSSAGRAPAWLSPVVYRLFREVMFTACTLTLAVQTLSVAVPSAACTVPAGSRGQDGVR